MSHASSAHSATITTIWRTGTSWEGARVASKRNRQRQLERARAERRLARAAHQTRRKRQVQAAVAGSIALVVIVLGTTWLLGGFDSKPETVASGTCSWYLKDAATDTNIRDVGHPPTTGEQRSGTAVMTISTSLGDIQANIDTSRAPCTAASFKFLGEKNFFDGTSCHRLDTTQKVLACGDPLSTGAGGPSYTFNDEDVPGIDASLPPATTSPNPSASAGASPRYYRKGQIVMVNTGANTNGSQFYIVYDDANTLSAAYSIVGTITKGLDIVEKVAKDGAVDDSGKASDQGKPKTGLTIQHLSVGPAATPSPTPSGSPATSAPPSAPPSATASPSNQS
jgi:peptidyl-prolyl cis-trans isomerase B (cyclophilin B)